MPRVHFVISSVPESEYRSTMKGYCDARDLPPPPLPPVASMKRAIARIISSLRSIRNSNGKTAPSAVEGPIYRGEHPILDPRFLAFCISAAQYLSRGYAIGPGDGKDFFYAYNEVSLSGLVHEVIENHDGWNRLIMPIAPHAYDEEIPDIPTYAHLLILQMLTRDPSVSRVLNRLALWLSYFVYSIHYCHKIIVYHPSTKDKKVLDTHFLQAFAQHMKI